MTDFNNLPFVTISSRQPSDENGFSSGDSAYGSSLGDSKPPSATHDISRVNYHLKRLPDFARALEESATRAFPNRGSSQRYRKVCVLLLHWDSDDLFVLPELEDLEICFQHDYNFETERFTLPSGNAHLELMLKIGAMIKDHESTDTLLVIYYAGHARIDDNRQSTWCASRSLDSPWLQWSAIQTLLERSLSDALILLDCCAGAASAAFPTGSSITETISASSWDAIAPNPGRYSFSATLLEVLQEWKRKTFSVAMLHAEILARLKHPRPERRNGGHFEARTTPVHFMMTANHRAPSIELCRINNDTVPPPLPSGPASGRSSFAGGRASPEEIIGSVPNETVPHVMVSLALEDDQTLNIEDWERWLASFPALAKYVQVQGVFKSHSTLLLLSLPIMVWDMLPDNPACNFVAFIRSNNLVARRQEKEPAQPSWNLTPSNVEIESDQDSIYSGTTTVTLDQLDSLGAMNLPVMDRINESVDRPKLRWPGIQADTILATRPPVESNVQQRSSNPIPQLSTKGIQSSLANAARSVSNTSNAQLSDQARSLQLAAKVADRSPTMPTLPAHVEKRLEEFFMDNPKPAVGVKDFLASNLGIETADLDSWFRHRREQQEVSNKLLSLRMNDQNHTQHPKDGARMILPGHLNTLLEMFPTGQTVVIDLRPNASYQRSHIHGAINFRAPASFVSRASFEMIERSLTDEASRSSFDKWYTSKCVIFYDKVVEYPWDAPVAEAFFQKFKSKHWPGQVFVLKGHYIEFSESFDKYIVGTNTTDKAIKYLASLQDASWEESNDDQQRYDDWLKLLDEEDRVHTTELQPAVKSERQEATDREQQALEVEFWRAFPALYQQAQNRQPDENWSVKAPLVAHLERGIAKMQHEAGLSRSSTTPLSSNVSRSNTSGGDGAPGNGPPQYTRYPSESHDSRGKGYARKEAEGDYNAYHHQSHHLNVWQGPEPTLHKSSSSSTLRGKASEEPSSGTMRATPPTMGPSTGPAQLDRRGPASIIKRIMRSGKPDAPPSR
ncbi:hypothetical protein F5B22DRAFT_300049 [Xylaria bambusicola]|uniref:uncharacterized protein n=1 Tax=Xylaria bambusicola TaxID=326684 RepID=UPI00200872EE|nr:uncharacterized protein F5B22DRAFT_300049 [Xylaria bambusicola]KAI0512639.1 hypothetical protein F5B22DRAFT_300049 [Xylaria bambusicola]